MILNRKHVKRIGRDEGREQVGVGFKAIARLDIDTDFPAFGNRTCNEVRCSREAEPDSRIRRFN